MTSTINSPERLIVPYPHIFVGLPESCLEKRRKVTISRERRKTIQKRKSREQSLYQSESTRIEFHNSLQSRNLIPGHIRLDPHLLTLEYPGISQLTKCRSLFNLALDVLYQTFAFEESLEESSLDELDDGSKSLDVYRYQYLIYPYAIEGDQFLEFVVKIQWEVKLNKPAIEKHNFLIPINLLTIRKQPDLGKLIFLVKCTFLDGLIPNTPRGAVRCTTCLDRSSYVIAYPKRINTKWVKIFNIRCRTITHRGVHDKQYDVKSILRRHHSRTLNYIKAKTGTDSLLPFLDPEQGRESFPKIYLVTANHDNWKFIYFLWKRNRRIPYVVRDDLTLSMYLAEMVEYMFYTQSNYLTTPRPWFHWECFSKIVSYNSTNLRHYVKTENLLRGVSKPKFHRLGEILKSNLNSLNFPEHPEQYKRYNF